MSKNYSTERVHFQMSGFSDRIIGVPSGMLIQVHTNSSSRGDIDEYRSSLRGSINSSIGTIKDTKEFFTKSNFGPAASVTTTLQQAPVNEAASHFRSVMQHLSGMTLTHILKNKTTSLRFPLQCLVAQCQHTQMDLQ